MNYENYQSFLALSKDFKFVVIPFIMVIMWYMADRLTMYLIKHISKVARSKISGDKKALSMRIRTLETLTRPVGRASIAAIFIITVLGQMGIDMRPVLAGVGVVGIGVSLAAKNILQDFLNGLLLLLENQYNVGDWVHLGNVSGLNDISGSVEALTFRITKIRTIDGDLVIVPNSAIVAVKNQSVGWSVANIEVGVPYGTDIRHALDIMKSCATDLKETLEYFADAEPEATIQGIVNFGASAVILRTLIKSPPGKQWEVARNYRMLLMDKFDAQGLQFAFNHLDVAVVEMPKMQDRGLRPHPQGDKSP